MSVFHPHSSPFYYKHYWLDLEDYLLEFEVKFPRIKIMLLKDFNTLIGDKIPKHDVED